MSDSGKALFYVEDDEALAYVTCRALRKKGFEVTHFTHVEAAQAMLPNMIVDYALLDLKLEDQISLSLIPSILEVNPGASILVLTGYGSIATAVQAIKLGAKDYLTKPSSIENVLKVFGAIDSKEEAVVVVDEGFSLKRLEWENIQRVLAENNGNVSATARQLKMHRRTLQRKLDKRPVGS